jgi:branched-chain amino acid transport system substrate-binding protein
LLLGGGQATLKEAVMRVKPAGIRPRFVLGGLVVAAACSVGATAVAGTGDKGAKPDLHIALVAAAVPGVDLLTPFAAGADAAASAINAKGGFGGRKVVIDTCNSKFNPAGVTVCANQLVGRRPVSEFGCEPSWSTGGGLQTFTAAGIPSMNCPTSSEDFNNPMEFGLNPAAVGQERGIARYLCTRKDIHSVYAIHTATPSLHENFRLAFLILQGCGKQIAGEIAYPVAAADVTPYVTQVAAAHPDFVMFAGSGAQVVLFFKGFQQNGIPASKISAPDTDFVYQGILSSAGSAMDGAYAINQFKSFGLTSDPEVKAYLAATKNSSVDPRDPTVEWGYAEVMWVYAAAQQIGFAKFNSASFVNFMRTKNKVHMPLGRSLYNPPPKKFPTMHQPYVQITQWKNGKMVLVKAGAGKDGWVYGY